MINVKGLFEYDELNKRYEKLVEGYGKLAEDYTGLDSLNREQTADYHERVEELQKYYSRITKEQKNRISQLQAELDTATNKLMTDAESHKKSIARLKTVIAKLEEKQQVRWNWISSRGEWWPVEGTMEQIRQRVPVPLTYKFTDEKTMTEKEVAEYGVKV